MLGIIKLPSIGFTFMPQSYSKNSIVNIEYPIKIISGHVLFRSVNSDGSYISMGIWSKDDVILPGKDWNTRYEIKTLSKTFIENISVESVPISSWERFNWYVQMSQQKSIRERLIALLKYLKTHFGIPYKNETMIVFTMTHDDLSTLVGSTRVTVTRLLKDIESEGIIERLGKSIIL